MARKTNKTNHVLGLLAGKNEEAVDAGTVETEKKQIAAEPKDKTPSAPNVQIVAKQEEDDAIADTVKQLLEEELDAEEIELPEPTMAAIGEEDVEDAEGFTSSDIEEIAVQETFEEKEELPDTDAAMQLSEEDQKELERLESEGNSAATENDYVFLNVMETLVNEIVDKWIRQFGVCTCSRCKADVIALALTNLPSKYVVVGRNAAAPLMNFYSQQFSGAITVEVTKACTKVMERPHHNRD